MHAQTISKPPAGNEGYHRLFLPAAAAFAVLAVAYPKLSLIAFFVTVVVFSQAQRAATLAPGVTLALRLILVSCTTVALLRFVLVEAVPGIMKGGNLAADKASVSQLRTIVTAEDAMRRHAYLDPDRDGIGSAVRILELAGKAAIPEKGLLNPAPLSYDDNQVLETRGGPAIQVGAYLFVVCIPDKSGALSADPASGTDAEAAERRFVAYAWPVGTGQGVSRAFATDEYESIWVSENKDGDSLRYAGANFPPPCEAAVDRNAVDRNEWAVWQGKKPRQRLPGADRERSAE